MSNFRKNPGVIVQEIGTARNPLRVWKTFQEQISFSKVVPKEVNEDSGTTKGSPSYGICALPTQATTSSGGVMRATKRQKHVGNPTQRMPENTSRVCSGFRNPGYFDSSKVNNSKDLRDVSHH